MNIRYIHPRENWKIVILSPFHYSTILLFRFFHLLIASLLFSVPVYSQIIIQGEVKDAVSKEKLTGVNISLNEKTGTATDTGGHYQLILDRTGKYALAFSYIGYKTLQKSISADTAGNYVMDVLLERTVIELENIVVTAGKYEQNINEVTVSMELLKRNEIENIKPVNMEQVLNQVPGVNVVQQQVNIRGGSGWSYGVGSRVLMLVDGLPMLTADAGDIKWNLLPLENAEQVEIIKGASSALYGASALGGIVNIHTAFPKDTPFTMVNLYSGYYDAPGNKELKYWSNPPVFGKVQWLHSRKIRNTDFVISNELFYDEGYRQEENDSRAKLFIKLQHAPVKVQQLKYGLGITVLADTGGNFLWWKNADSAYLPFPNTVSRFENYRLAIDPFIHYLTKNNSKHSLLGRTFLTQNTNNTGQESGSELYYGEYQFQKNISLKENYQIAWTSGVVFSYSNVNSPGFYGKHEGNTVSAYSQLEQKTGKINFSLGSRMESYELDTFKREYFPIFRSGISIQVAKAGFLRASLGQGIRFPSVAEKFVKTESGGLRIFPNPDLKPETGWSGEAGWRQGYHIGNVQGYVDAAGFWTEYKDMIEFTFGNYDPPAGINGFGFAAVNKTDARIYGTEITGTGEWKWQKFINRFMLGYTFMVPLDMKYVPQSTDTLGTEKFLKYRYRHIAKGGFNITYKSISFGGQFRYNSYMMNIDTILHVVMPGLREYRQENQRGDFIADGYISVAFLKYFELGFFVKNIFNREYLFVPGNIGAPRSYAVQLRMEI